MASYKLGRTQRGLIRQINQEDTEITDGIELTERKSIAENTGPESRKSGCDTSKPKAILLLVTVLALVAGIIVLVVLVKGNGPEGIGHIIEEENAKSVSDGCRDVSVVLGEGIVINCIFRDSTVIQGKVIAVHSNPALKLNGSCVKNDTEGGKRVNCTIGKANCSSKGTYDILFYDGDLKDAKVVFKKSVFVNVTAPSNQPSANISQVFKNNGDTSIFLMRCSYAKDCNIYSMRFSRKRNYTLAEPLQCNLAHSDSGGHSISCQANVTEKRFIEYSSGTDLICEVEDGGSVLYSAKFPLPNCPSNETDTISTEGCNDTVAESTACANASADDCNGTMPKLSECTNTSANNCNATMLDLSGCTNTSAKDCNVTMLGMSECINTLANDCNATILKLSGCTNSSANHCNTTLLKFSGCISVAANYCNATMLDLSGCTNTSANDCNATMLDVSGCINTSANDCNATMLKLSECTNTSANHCNTTMLKLSGCISAAANYCNVTMLDMSGCTNTSANDCNATMLGLSGCINTLANDCNATMLKLSECTNTSANHCNTTMLKLSSCISANGCKTNCPSKQECIGLVFNGFKWEGEDCCRLSWCWEKKPLIINKHENYRMIYKRCGRK